MFILLPLGSATWDGCNTCPHPALPQAMPLLHTRFGTKLKSNKVQYTITDFLRCTLFHK